MSDAKAVRDLERALFEYRGAVDAVVVLTRVEVGSLRAVLVLAKRAMELEAALRRVVIADERFRADTGLTGLDDPIVAQVKAARALLNDATPRAKGRGRK